MCLPAFRPVITRFFCMLVLLAGTCIIALPPASAAGPCSDSIDNDGDGLADIQDPDCHSDGNIANGGSFNSGGTESVACKPRMAGTVTTTYFNTQGNSVIKHVTFPVACPNPSVISQSFVESTLCSTNGAGPTGCPNNPSSTSTDLHSSVINVNSAGFDVFISSDDPVWVGAVSPQFPIGWQATCGTSSISVPVCPSTMVVGGTTTAAYGALTGNGNSPATHITFPATCVNPTVTAAAYTDGFLCAARNPTCPNNPGTTSADIHASVVNVTSSGFDTLLTSDDAMANTPAVTIGYQAMCENPVQNAAQGAYSGVVTTGYYNTLSNSVPIRVNFPASCPNPAVVAQSYTDSVLCSTNGSGPTICPNNPGTTSTDIRAHVVNVSASGFDVFLTSDDPVWVGASSPAFPIAWQATCGDVAGSSSSVSSSSSSSSSSTPNTGLGCIRIVKQSLNAAGVPVASNEAFTFTLDGNASLNATNDASGIATLNNVAAPGLHTVAEVPKSGWTLQSVSPANGEVLVQPGSTCATVTFVNRQTGASSSSSSSPSACFTLTNQTYTSIYSAGDFGCMYDLGVNGHNNPEAVIRGSVEALVPTSQNSCGNFSVIDLGVATHTISGLTAQWSAGDGACIYTCPQDYALISVVAENTVSAADCNNYACRYIGSGGDQIALQSTWNPSNQSCIYTCPAGYALQGFVAEDTISSADCNSFGTGCQRIGNLCQTPAAQCSDNADNDSDGKIDSQDPGCHSDGNAANAASYVPTDNDEFNAASSSSSSVPTTTSFGCIRVTKQTLNAAGAPINTSDNFSFWLDGNQGLTQTTDASGSATFQSVAAPGMHHIDEFAKNGWALQSVSPAGGDVMVQPGSNCATVTFVNRQTGGSSSSSSALAQCQDGIDNDNDGAIDFPSDFSCSSATDNDETNPKAQCQDGIDNDGDGQGDGQDPGCAGNQDNDETDTACSGFQYHLTVHSTAVIKPDGSSTGDPPVSCPQLQSALPGWSPVDSQCLIQNSINCTSIACLWKRPSTQMFTYVMTASSVAQNQSTTCGGSPPAAGYNLVMQNGALNGANGGFSTAVCFWSKPTTDGLQEDLAIGHQGSGGTPIAGCQTQTPASFILKQRVGIFVAGNGNLISDLCLYGKTTSVCPVSYQCSDGTDNDSDGRIDSADAGCHSDANPYNAASYVPTDNDEASPGNAQCNDGADNDSDGLADIQDPGCHSDGNAANAASYVPSDNNEADDAQCEAPFEYKTTMTSTAYWSPAGAFSASGPVTCPSAGAGWSLVDSECLVSGGPCYALVCLWKRPSSAAYSYVINHAGGNYYNSLSCANYPPAGYTLKSRGCVANNSVAPYNCFSDQCLWEKVATNAATLVFTHHGSNGTAVDCRTAPPAGYALNSQICLLSNGPCYSDLCLWQKAAACTISSSSSSSSASPVQCSDGADNDGDGKIDAQDPGCHSDANPYNAASYVPTDNDEASPANAQCNDGADNDSDGLTDIQDPGCHSDANPANPASYVPTDNMEASGGSSSSSSTASTGVGCIRIVKQAQNAAGAPINSTEPFTFTLDGNPSLNVTTDANGNATFQNVAAPGIHTVAELSKSGWTLQSMSPANGEVLVQPGGNCAVLTVVNRQTGASSSSSSSSIGQGCIKVFKETYNASGQPIATVAQFTFVLDGGVQIQNDANGNAQFNAVSTGVHTVTEVLPQGWNQLNVTPASGVVIVSPGSQCAGVVFKNQQTLPVSSSSSSSSVANANTGCIRVNKQVLNSAGAPMSSNEQFSFWLDGNQGITQSINGNGSVVFQNIAAPGMHQINEFAKAGWIQQSVSPQNGDVMVYPGSTCADVNFVNRQAP